MNSPISAAACTILVDVMSPSDVDVDVSLFLLTDTDRVRGDQDMIFYGQPVGSSGAVRLSSSASVGNKRTTIDLNLVGVDPDIKKLAVTATIDQGITRNQNFSMVQGVSFKLTEQGSDIAYHLPTAGANEVAMIIGYVYRHNGGWKFRALGQGFAGGLKALGESFGVDIAPETPTSAPVAADVQPVSRKIINLQKIVSLEKGHPQLAKEARTAMVSLEKAGQSDLCAKVKLVLDISGSMHPRYQSGAVDALVRRILAVGLQLDDDGEIDVYLFGRGAYEFGTINRDNYQSFTRDMLARRRLEDDTRYGEVMRIVRDSERDTTTPVYVMMVTDGDCADKDNARRMILDSSREAIFWQFMAIGPKPTGTSSWLLGSKRLPKGFDFLASLDTMSGRYIDNANFFTVEDPNRIEDAELYDLMFPEFPTWLREAKQKGLVT